MRLLVGLPMLCQYCIVVLDRDKRIAIINSNLLAASQTHHSTRNFSSFVIQIPASIVHPVR